MRTWISIRWDVWNAIFFYLSLVHSIISAPQNRYKFVTAINILHHLSEYAVHPNVSYIQNMGETSYRKSLTYLGKMLEIILLVLLGLAFIRKTHCSVEHCKQRKWNKLKLTSSYRESGFVHSVCLCCVAAWETNASLCTLKTSETTNDVCRSQIIPRERERS